MMRMCKLNSLKFCMPSRKEIHVDEINNVQVEIGEMLRPIRVNILVKKMKTLCSRIIMIVVIVNLMT